MAHLHTCRALPSPLGMVELQVSRQHKDLVSGGRGAATSRMTAGVDMQVQTPHEDGVTRVSVGRLVCDMLSFFQFSTTAKYRGKNSTSPGKNLSSVLPAWLVMHLTHPTQAQRLCQSVSAALLACTRLAHTFHDDETHHPVSQAAPVLLLGLTSCMYCMSGTSCSNAPLLVKLLYLTPP